MPGISELLDSNMDSLDFIDENSLISSVSDTTILKPEKKTKKRVCVGMPKKPAKRPARKQPAGDDLIEIEPPKRKTKKPAATKRAPRKKPAPEPTPEPEFAEPEAESLSIQEQIPSPVNLQSNFAPKRAPAPKPVKRTADSSSEEPPTKRARPAAQPFRRAASVLSDTSADPTLRRKLGDITRKFEALDNKYRQLKETGLDEAAANVDKLRRQCTAMSEASDHLVSTLKSQLSQQTALAQNADRVQKQSVHQKSKAQEMELEIAKLRKQNEDLSKTLNEAQGEIKSLNTKLVAARATPPAPAAAVKKPETKKVVAGTENEKSLQLKIDLYGDLTGLIVRSVKQTDAGDTYDCIQTGRNGSKSLSLLSRFTPMNPQSSQVTLPRGCPLTPGVWGPAPPRKLA